MSDALGRNGSVPETLFYDMIIDRDYSLTEDQDYRKNILPYKKLKYIIQPIGDHRYGYFVLTSWRMHYTGSNKC